MRPAITGLFAGLVNATRAMQYAQFAMNVHNQNIARSTDPNHTRLESVAPWESGLNTAGVKRIRDIFIDEQYRTSTTSLGYWGAKHDIFSRVEDIFGDPVEGGLRLAIDQFFDKWQAVAESPADGVARLEVLSAGRTFVQQIKYAYSQIEAVEQRAAEMIVAYVDEVNNLLATVHQLNGRIAITNEYDPVAAELRDQRDAALDRLAYLTGARPQELEDGTVRVMIGSVPAVDGPSLVRLKVVGYPPTLEWEGGYFVPFKGSGALGGLLDAWKMDLDRLKTDLKALAKAVADAVNELHRSGTGLDGVSGRDFFVTSPEGEPFELSNFAVNPELEAHMVAAGTTGLDGDGTIARQIYLLADAPLLTSTIIPDQPQSPRTFYRTVVGWIGSQAKEVGTLAEIAHTHQQLNAEQRQSAWGVSLDEEVAFLTLQQKAFAAAARIFNVMDEMLDLLINSVGVRW